MTIWLRRNFLALTLIGVAIVVFAATVGYPSWKKGVGAWQPVVDVPFGKTSTIEGTEWRLTGSLHLAAGEIRPASEGLEHSRLAIIGFERKWVSTSHTGCWLMWMVDSTGRRWGKQGKSELFRAQRSLEKQGLSTSCDDEKPYPLALFVANDAQIVAVDFLVVGSVDAPRKIIRFRTPSVL